jgi:GNAT superfamily N-acetyltransferase
MLYEAAYWGPDGPKPPRLEALGNPALARYVDGWGRPGDAGIVALAESGEPIGAAWYRLFSPNDGGFGFVDEHTPELSLAVVPEARGDGVGTGR